MCFHSLGWKSPLEEHMATHSSILAWRIPKDRGAWRVTVHGVTKSRTQLKQPGTLTHTHLLVKKMVPLQNHQLSFLLDILIYIYTYLKNWLTWLWRLGSPKDLYSKGLRPRRGSGISSSPSLRAKGDWCPSSKTSRKRMNSSLFRFYLGLRWTEWTSLKFGVKSALLSLQIQKLISSRNTFIDTPRIMFNQVSGPCGTVKLTNKINHHNLPPEKTKQNLSPLTSTSSSITLPFHSLSQWNFSEDLCLSTMLPSSEACPLSRPMKCQTLPQCPYST